MKYLNRWLIGISLLFILFGGGLWLYLNNSQPIINKVFATKSYHKQPTVAKISGKPVELLIPSMSMDLKVIPGYYDPITQTWNLTLDEVQYATITPEPNNLSGNTFFYGHYRPEVFAYLHLIPAQAQAIVKTANNHSFYYQLASIRTTSPYDDSVFSYKGPPILTIQTCTGPLFQYRQFYTFNLEKVV